MKNSEIKSEAKKLLSGNWGKACGISFLFFLLQFTLNLITGIFKDSDSIFSILMPILNLVLSIPLSYGLYDAFVKIKYNNEVGYTFFITSMFDNFGRAWGIFGRILLKFLPIIILEMLCVILAPLVALRFSFIFALILNLLALGLLIYLAIESCCYTLAYVAACEYPELSPKEIFEDTKSLLKTYDNKFIWLSLSFIGWSILSVLTFGIGSIFLVPYMFISYIVFYDNIKSSNQ